MSAKSEYEMLLDLGELKELYPSLTGIWEEDEDIFNLLWQSNQDILKDIDINDFEQL